MEVIIMKNCLIGILVFIILCPVITIAQEERAAQTATKNVKLARVHVISGGGTIMRNPKNRLEFIRYAQTGEPSLTLSEMIERIPEVQQFASVTTESKEYRADTTEELKILSLLINTYLKDPNISGVVFVKGTSTVEDTAYFLNLTIKSDKPVVVTGSQRPFTTLSSDGPMNLLNAIRVAADPGSRGKGALVVANDEINSAREVTKTNTYRVETYQGRQMGLLGYADIDKITYYRVPTRKHTTQTEFDLSQIKSFPRVDILYAYGGGDAELAKAAVAIGAKGLVIAGMGSGQGNDLKTLKELYDKQGTRIVRSSRVGNGRVIRDDNWQAPGLIASDSLNPNKSRLLLQLALTKTTDVDEIQRMFYEY
jgi:L-asparaginase